MSFCPYSNPSCDEKNIIPLGPPPPILTWDPSLDWVENGFLGADSLGTKFHALEPNLTVCTARLVLGHLMRTPTFPGSCLQFLQLCPAPQMGGFSYLGHISFKYNTSTFFFKAAQLPWTLPPANVQPHQFTKMWSWIKVFCMHVQVHSLCSRDNLKAKSFDLLPGCCAVKPYFLAVIVKGSMRNQNCRIENWASSLLSSPCL